MGISSWDDSNCFSCFRAKFRPNEDTPLQQLPKPKEAEPLEYINTIDGREEPDVLIIRYVDPCIKLNGSNHRTSKYELMNRVDPSLVVRRGQSFYLSITLSRPYQEYKDAISFIFTVDDEDKPSFGQGTLAAAPLLNRYDKHYSWNVMLESSEQNTIMVQIIADPECVVAKWRMEIDTRIIGGGSYSYSWGTDLYILFNPWCKEDQVYLNNDEWREESVLTDVGLIYRGTFNRIRPCIWKYQQFEKNILECSLYLIKHVGKVHGNSRSDPIITARELSGAVNSVDDNGAVMGNWGDDFSDGTAPTKWIGSMEILQQYYKKKKSVKYGQCWVFGGVLTTICRAVGIPCRTITNYKSAHDTQGSLTVDYFMDKDGKLVDELNSDSIWNFHVWNEVWMKRPDLGSIYAGWQAIDATPQEQSGDKFRVGPTSVAAVKFGEVKRAFDTGFLIAEVNADKVYWRYNGPTEPLKLLAKDIHAIGKLMITKTPKKWDFENITYTYKYPESADEERVVMFRALRQLQNMFARYYINSDFNDILFNLEMKDDIKIGQPFNIVFVMRNVHKTMDYSVIVSLRIDSVTYTGKLGECIKEERFKVLVKSGSTTEVQTNVTFEEYHKKLLDQAAFNVTCLASVLDYEFEYYTQDEYRVRKPDIKIVLNGHAKQNQEVHADVYLENPLPIPLRKGEFSIDAPGFTEKLIIKLKSDVPPGKKALTEFNFIPPKSGNQTIAAKFVSKELQDVDGFLNIFVEPSTEITAELNGI